MCAFCSIKKFSFIFFIKKDIHIYMLPIAGQTAEPNRLKFFVDTHGWLGVVLGYKKFLFFPRATPGPSTSE